MPRVAEAKTNSITVAGQSYIRTACEAMIQEGANLSCLDPPPPPPPTPGRAPANTHMPIHSGSLPLAEHNLQINVMTYRQQLKLLCQDLVAQMHAL